MRRIALLGCAALLVACAKREGMPGADTMAAAPAAMLSPADVAGTWTVNLMSETTDSVVVTYELMATATTEGWTITLPNRPPTAVRVMFSGDSVMTNSDPVESVLRPGVQVSADGVLRVMDGKLVGWTTAHYSVTTADSVRRFRFEGTRKQ
ncbi:MAG: hypothetical protein ACT4PM_12210 [Gemmatimonadales bacterium]